MLYRGKKIDDHRKEKLSNYRLKKTNNQQWEDDKEKENVCLPDITIRALNVYIKAFWNYIPIASCVLGVMAVKCYSKFPGPPGVESQH